MQCISSRHGDGVGEEIPQLRVPAQAHGDNRIYPDAERSDEPAADGETHELERDFTAFGREGRQHITPARRQAAVLALWQRTARAPKMEQGKDQQALVALGGWLDRYWKWVVVGAWLLFCAYYLWQRWNAVQLFALIDTDDNLRMSQVRDRKSV